MARLPDSVGRDSADSLEVSGTGPGGSRKTRIHPKGRTIMIIVTMIDTIPNCERFMYL